MAIHRRDFLLQLGASLALPAHLSAARELACDVAVIGGGTGGCAAALGALRNGMQVIMTEETDWIGGQLTSQACLPTSTRGSRTSTRLEPIETSAEPSATTIARIIP